MNQQTHSRAGLFLMELMLNILFFSVLVAMCLQFFFKAHNLAESTTTLHRAVSTCTSLAEVYQSGVNGKESLLLVYPDAILLNENLLIYFDEHFAECSENDSYYRALITFSNNTMQNAEITFFSNNDAGEIYHLEVSGYRPQTISNLAGGSFQ